MTARIIDSPILKRLFNFCGGQMNENSLWIKNGSKITITDRMPNWHYDFLITNRSILSLSMIDLESKHAKVAIFDAPWNLSSIREYESFISLSIDDSEI